MSADRSIHRRRFLLAACGAALVPPWWALRRALATEPAAPASERAKPASKPVESASKAASTTAAKPAAPPSRSAERDAALAVARQQIILYCAHLDFPNGAIHAVRALGRDAPLGVGDPFRLLLENYVVENWIGGRVVLEVPVEREGHRNAMLKTLLEKKCPLDLPFTLEGRDYHFADFVESARLLVSYPGNVPIDEHSWTIIAFAPRVPASEPAWTNIHGQPVDLGRMIDDTSAALEHDTALIRRIDVMRPDPPRDCPVYRRACGGLHMLYALAIAMAHGWDTPARREAFALHVRTAILRLSYDENVIASVERDNLKIAGKDAARGVSYDARIKFLGHFMEIVGAIDAGRAYVFNAAERRAVDAARQRLYAALIAGRDLQIAGYKGDKDLYESMTTNICHAYNGLEMSPG